MEAYVAEQAQRDDTRSSRLWRSGKPQMRLPPVIVRN